MAEWANARGCKPRSTDTVVRIHHGARRTGRKPGTHTRAGAQVPVHGHAPVVQGTGHRPPKAETQVRVLLGAPRPGDRTAQVRPCKGRHAGSTPASASRWPVAKRTRQRPPKPRSAVRFRPGQLKRFPLWSTGRLSVTCGSLLIAGWSRSVAREFHKLEVGGSSPPPATMALAGRGRDPSRPGLFHFTGRLDRQHGDRTPRLGQELRAHKANRGVHWFLPDFTRTG